MKRSFLVFATALSLGIPGTALAGDINAIDLFVGDFAGIATLNIGKLAANKMVDDAVSGAGGSAGFNALLKDLNAAGLDYKKDIDTITVGSNDKGRVCLAVDSKKELKPVLDNYAKKNNLKPEEYNGLTIMTDGSNQFVLLSDKRLLGCEKLFDIKPMIENAKADKPKTLKDRDAVVYKAYQQSDKDADIRFGGRMTKHLKDQSKDFKLENAASQSIAMSDIDSGTVSISFAKGLSVSVIATTASNDTAKNGAAIINEQLTGLLDEQMLNELGIGFVKKAYNVVSDKKNVVATIKFSDREMVAISALVADLTKGSMPSKPAKQPTAKKGAEANEPAKPNKAPDNSAKDTAPNTPH